MKLRSGGRGVTKLRLVLADLRRPVAAVLLLIASLALASCGGGGGKQDVQDLLDKAFKADIKSADLKVDATIPVQGNASLERPVRIQASGPFRSNPAKLPSADMELRIGTDGGGQTVQTGFLSTGDRAFVKFQDVYYEQPASEVRKANASIKRNEGRRSSLGALGLNPRSWLAEAKEEDEEKVAGVDTRHVSGRLDVEALLKDLNDFVKRSGSAIGGATGQTPPEPLGKDDIARIKEVVKSPSFDVYVGEEDDTIRRVSGRVELQVPERDRKSAGGSEGGSLEFSIEFRDVNGDQKVDAPAKARPLSDLTDSLGTRSLGGLGGGSGSDSGDRQQQPQQGQAPTTTAPDAEAFREYADCLEKSRPDDTEALQRCAALLQEPGGTR